MKPAKASAQVRVAMSWWGIETRGGRGGWRVSRAVLSLGCWGSCRRIEGGRATFGAGRRRSGEESATP